MISLDLVFDCSAMVWFNLVCGAEVMPTCSITERDKVCGYTQT